MLHVALYVASGLHRTCAELREQMEYRFVARLHTAARKLSTASGGSSHRVAVGYPLQCAIPKAKPSPPGGPDASRRAPRSTPARTSTRCVCVAQGGSLWVCVFLRVYARALAQVSARACARASLCVSCATPRLQGSVGS
jgi:hypothetical protein